MAAVEELFRGLPFRCGSTRARTFGHAVLHDVLRLHRAEVALGRRLAGVLVVVRVLYGASYWCCSGFQ